VEESYVVYLEHPVAGEDLEEERSAEFPSVIEATIVLRRVAVHALGTGLFQL
jgi:hypothetical protein